MYFLRMCGRVAGRPLCRGRALLFLCILPLLLASAPETLEAQWPGSVSGRVIDAYSGRAVVAVTLRLEPTGSLLESDGSGGFRSRGLEPGRYRLTAQRIGYLDGGVEVEIRNGEVTRVLLELEPAAIDVDGVAVSISGVGEEGAFRIGRDRIAASGARSAGDVLRTMPGVVVRETSPGGPQTVIVRGAGADAVLVLVDGAPLNDPVTGEADLSTIFASSIEEIVLYRGAHSARFGAGAHGGAVLIRTRGPSERWHASLSTGSLGEAGLSLATGSAGDRFDASARADFRRMRGSFVFRDPVDPARGFLRRTNADAGQLVLGGSADGRLAGGEARGRIGFEAMERGLPGASFAPSRTARQELRRGRASLAWRHDDRPSGSAPASGSIDLTAYAVLQESVARDPAPPFGLAFDDATRHLSSGVRVELVRSPKAPITVGAGGNLRYQRVRSDPLATGSSTLERFDPGFFLHGRIQLLRGAHAPELSLAVRAQRDGVGARWHPGHEAVFSVPAGIFRIRIAHRASVTPPSLGDQFFREGVGVAPNPALRPERVPSEWEAGLGVRALAGTSAISGGIDLFRGDIRDMIVWSPDFRFIWSPRNVDVKRAGADVWGDVRMPAGIGLRGGYTYARTTYAGRGGTPGVQLAYRPRHAARVALDREGARWRAEVGARFTGARYPVPAAVNRMPPFWSAQAAVSKVWPIGDWRIESRARVDRLLDSKDSLIFGFPEPGRTLVVDLDVRRR